MTDLIINTNEVTINEGEKKSNLVRSDSSETTKELLEEMNRKLDLLLSEKEASDGETNN